MTDEIRRHLDRAIAALGGFPREASVVKAACLNTGVAGNPVLPENDLPARIIIEWAERNGLELLNAQVLQLQMALRPYLRQQEREVDVGCYTIREHKTKTGGVTILRNQLSDACGEGGIFSAAGLEAVIGEFYAKHF